MNFKDIVKLWCVLENRKPLSNWNWNKTCFLCARTLFLNKKNMYRFYEFIYTSNLTPDPTLKKMQRQ